MAGEQWGANDRSRSGEAPRDLINNAPRAFDFLSHFFSPLRSPLVRRFMTVGELPRILAQENNIMWNDGR